MTGKIAGNLPALCTALGALVIASGLSTAKADQPGPANIPERAPENDESAPPLDAGPALAELPRPYQAWQGAGFGPPRHAPEPDLPPPLARPRELARRPFELTAAVAAFLPSCAAGSIDNRGCQTVGPGAGLDAALLYRVGWFFGVGVEGVLSGFGGEGHGALSSAGGGARFVGVTSRVYFAHGGAWDPYASLALGYGWLDLRRARGALGSAATTGLGARVTGGVDYLFGSRLRLGPTLGFAHWLAWSETRCSGATCRAGRPSYGRLLGFATLGLRVTGSFGDAL